MTLSMFSAISSSTATPGPGAYEEDKLYSVGGVLSLKNTIRPKYSQTKGYIHNAQYIPPKSSLSTIRHSIGARLSQRECEETVGPSYLPNPKENFTRGVKIKSIPKSPKLAKTPGPDRYSPEFPSSTAIPAQGARGPLKLSIIPESPGPAAYDINRDVNKDSKQVSIRPRTSYEPLDDPNPGYSFNHQGQLGKEARKSAFSKAVRTTDYSTIAPGPGAYEADQRPSTAIGPYIHQTLESRNRLADSADSLYDLRKYPELKKNTISPLCGKRACDSSSSTPGPSFYPNTSLNLHPLSIHNKFDHKQSQHTPGPGDYTPMSPGGMIRLQCSMKGPEERSWFTPDVNNPGPAAYKVEIKNTLPKWSIGERSISRDSNRARTVIDYSRDRSQTSEASRSKGLSSKQSAKKLSETAPVKH